MKPHEQLSRTEHINDTVWDRIGETTVGQMNDLTEWHHLVPDEGYFSFETSAMLSDYVKERGDHLKDDVIALGYYDNEVTPAAIERLKVYLLTPRALYAQEKRTRDDDVTLVRELCEYNEALRNMVRLNPDMKRSDLEAALHASIMWAGLPDTSRAAHSAAIRSTLDGVTGELVMEQLARSKIARDNGITCEETSVEDDLHGSDLRLSVPVRINNKPITVPVELDIKFNINRIRDLQEPGDESKAYAVVNDKVVIWAHVHKSDLQGKMLLDQSMVEHRSWEAIPAIQWAAKELYRRRQLAGNLGIRALRGA